jgi:predicted Zn-dependent peptidase
VTTTDTGSAQARPIPALGKPRTAKVPTVADTTLDNGLRVLAVRRPGVPLVEMRLRVPFAGPSGRAGESHVARAQLLGDTLLSGTDRRTASQIAVDLQSLGGQLNASTDADRLAITGSVLASGFPGMLELLG